MGQPSGASRAQSEAVGVILLMGIVILTLGALGVLGANSFEDTKAGVSIEIAEHEMSRLAGEIEDVAIGSSRVKTVDLDLDTAGSLGTTVVREDSGSIHVMVGDDLVYTGDLGVIEYENSDVRIAYQAGGVWRESQYGNFEIVQRPPFSEENLSTPTLSVPLVSIVGTDGLSDGAVIERAGVTQPYPSLVVPEDEAVLITIESRYALAWGRYFVENLGIPEDDVSIDQSTNRVTINYGEGELVYFHFAVYEVKVVHR